jgi:acetyl esterase/lipase
MLVSLVLVRIAHVAAAPALTIEGPFGHGPDQVWIVRPATAVRVVVVFGHGWKQTQPSPPGAWVGQFEPWIGHLAARGAAVIFPRYQLGGDDPTPATIGAYRAGLSLGFARLAHPARPVVVMGYSYGASLAFYYAANSGQWRLPRPAAVDSVFPAGLISTARLPLLPRSTRVLIQVGDHDQEAGKAGAQGFWSWLTNHPRSLKRYEVVRSRSAFLADHAAPKRTTGAARSAFWTPLDTLIAAVERKG